MLNVVDLACELISRPSITPVDAGCQRLIADLLTQHGFHCEHIRFNDVDNLWATHGTTDPVVTLLGHTDVVPTGPLEQWTTPPFEPTIHNNRLYGRGSADMKGSIAAFVVALINYVNQYPNHRGTVSLLITSDEEGVSLHGVRQVMQLFSAQGKKIHYCIVGEPSSENHFGDIIKVGRRGSLSGNLRILGKQGHIAYPDKADNPIPKALPALNALCRFEWDQGNADFPPTSFQIYNIQAGTGA